MDAARGFARAEQQRARQRLAPRGGRRSFGHAAAPMSVTPLLSAWSERAAEMTDLSTCACAAALLLVRRSSGVAPPSRGSRMAIAVIDRKEGRLLRRRVRVSTSRGRTLSNTKTSEKVAAHTLWRASRRAERSESAASSSASRKISPSRDAQGSSVAVTLVVRGAARYVHHAISTS